ncbi:ATP-dependent DNA ligase [Arthrobacter sp. GAS37]
MTKDRELPVSWFEEMPATGIEGLVRKGASQVYVGGKKQWLR